METTRKKELKQQAKELSPTAGILMVTNTVNGKYFIDSTANIKRLNGLKFELKMGSLLNKQLVGDWNAYGEDAFTFEVLESIKTEGKSPYQVKTEVAEAKDKWLNEKQPYGDRGYN